MSMDWVLEMPTNCHLCINHLAIQRDWDILPEGYGTDVSLESINQNELPICSKHLKEYFSMHPERIG